MTTTHRRRGIASGAKAGAKVKARVEAKVGVTLVPDMTIGSIPVVRSGDAGVDGGRTARNADQAGIANEAGNASRGDDLQRAAETMIASRRMQATWTVGNLMMNEVAAISRVTSMIGLMPRPVVTSTMA